MVKAVQYPILDGRGPVTPEKEMSNAAKAGKITSGIVPICTHFAHHNS